MKNRELNGVIVSLAKFFAGNHACCAVADGDYQAVIMVGDVTITIEDKTEQKGQTNEADTTTQEAPAGGG